MHSMGHPRRPLYSGCVQNLCGQLGGASDARRCPLGVRVGQRKPSVYQPEKSSPLGPVNGWTSDAPTSFFEGVSELGGGWISKSQV